MAEEQNRYEALAKPLKVYFIVSTIVGIGLAVYYIFGLCIGGFSLFDAEYYYLLFGIFGSSIFLFKPENKKFQWYDLVLLVVFLALCVYFFLNGQEIAKVGWVPTSTFNTALAFIFLLICLEACRRVAGFGFPIVALIFGIFPLITGKMPGVLEGISYPLSKAVAFYTFGGEGVIGLPGSVIGNILIGFLVFAGFLIATGAGKTFLDVAYALLGKYRGGPAKVAVVASGLFGSLSGSIFSNIVATGSITIPAMKRMGYSSHYAGAIEACASTGGALMPPVMGITAFIMCAMLDIPYSVVIVAAVLPAILYYFGLLVQVDAYAARVGLKGLPREELPSLWGALKKGWLFGAVLAFLIWGLVYMKWEYMTPFYATALLLVLSSIYRETMMTPRRLVNCIAEAGKLIATTTAILLPIGIIVSAITTTGVGAAFTSAAVAAGGENVLLILLLGTIVCYVTGMAGIGVAAYVFLAVSMAPSLIQIGGLNTIAVHLFIVYYVMLSVITPPVAGGAFIAASIAGASPMRTAVTAMRLGIVIYFIPFFFVFNPSLILQGPILESIYRFALCLLGITLIAAGLENHLFRVGSLPLWERLLLIGAGFLIGFPEWNSTFIGGALAFLVIAIILVKKRRTSVRLATSE